MKVYCYWQTLYSHLTITTRSLNHQEVKQKKIISATTAEFHQKIYLKTLAPQFFPISYTYKNASEWISTHCALCSCYFNAMGTTPFVSDQVCTSLVLVSLFAIQRQPASQASYTSTYSHCQVVRILYLCLQGLQLKIAKYPTPRRYNYKEENSIEGMKKLRNLLSVFDYRQFKFDKRCSDAHLWSFLFYYYCNTT